MSTSAAERKSKTTAALSSDPVATYRMHGLKDTPAEGPAMSVWVYVRVRAKIRLQSDQS